MSSYSFHTSAPGSIMLFGEHAVLRGYPAIVCAVNRRIYLTLTPKIDSKIYIKSALGELETTLEEINNIKIQPPFHFILATLKYFKLSQGVEINIKSEFSDKIGLGSSAAVVVALVAALRQWQKDSDEKMAIYQNALAIIRQVQGLGSGADVAASVFGGVLEYQIPTKPSPIKIGKLSHFPPLHLIYTGYKTPTVTVVKQVNVFEKAYPDLAKKIFKKINTCVKQAILATQSQDWKNLGKIANKHYQWQCELGVSDPHCDALIKYYSNQKNIFGAKLSGSGLGDCIVLIGDFKKSMGFNAEQILKGACEIAVSVESEGVILHTAF